MNYAMSKLIKVFILMIKVHIRFIYIYKNIFETMQRLMYECIDKTILLCNFMVSWKPIHFLAFFSWPNINFNIFMQTSITWNWYKIKVFFPMKYSFFAVIYFGPLLVFCWYSKLHVCGLKYNFCHHLCVDFVFW